MLTSGTSMQIIKNESSNLEDSLGCKLNYIHVKVTDIKNKAEEIMSLILDDSWLTKLDDAIDKVSFISRSKPTIELLETLLKEVGSEIGAEFGEILVSCSAQSVMEDNHAHEKFPLAELWKEKAKVNPGFDFHTISPSELLFFGEAKFNSNVNSYSTAISQICSFISKGKDLMELTDLRKLNVKITDDHLTPNKKGYIAAFSVHNNFDEIFNVIKSSKKLRQHLSKYPELYFIGIEVC